MTIAQRFNAGVGHPDKIESRTGTKGASDRPIGLSEEEAVLPSLTGLGSFCDRDPSVKTLGYSQGKDAKHIRALRRPIGKTCGVLSRTRTPQRGVPTSCVPTF
jgi:hypothetical protein